jgi:DNA-binding PadR family transcriptional regulator
MPPRSDARSRFALLGALTIEPMSGYDLRRFFSENLAFFWSESFGQIYPMLRMLEAEGLVTAKSTAGARRRVYRISRAGRRALAEWLARPAAVETPRVETLLKLFFAQQGPPDAARAHVQRLRDEHTQRLARYDAVTARLDGELAHHPEARDWRIALSYGRHVSAALLAWCDETERALRAPGGAH